MLGKLAEIRQVANVRSMFDQSGVTAGEYYIGQSTVLGQIAWKIIGKIMLWNLQLNTFCTKFFLRHTQSGSKWIETAYSTQITVLNLDTTALFPILVWLERLRGGTKRTQIVSKHIHRMEKPWLFYFMITVQLIRHWENTLKAVQTLEMDTCERKDRNVI